MLTHYFANIMLGVYYYPRPQWGQAQIANDLRVFAEVGLKNVWLFYDPFYDVDDSDGLGAVLDTASTLGLSIVPSLGQFTTLQDDLKIVNADGSTSDDPRYWNMGCFRNPRLLELAVGRAVRFFEEFGEHPALYRLEGKPAMNFVHEAYYRNNVPEFGNGAMKPSCYCTHCCAAFRDYLAQYGFDADAAPPIDQRDPLLWQHWLDCHAEAIPQFLAALITTTKSHTPLWATHECNDFYPASWQSVYTGNDWWRMGAVLDFGHEDMYPLEFDTRYQCYVYNYAKDVMRSAMNFDGLITANGQAFNSWLGYQLPENSMSEQVYSALAHGALGLIWWTQLPSPPAHAPYLDEATVRYAMIRKTQQANADYLHWVQRLAGYQPMPAQIALVYSWTTMCQALNDEHTYDTLLMYMLLTQCGYPVDIVSENQIIQGVLGERGYPTVFALGCAALPSAVHTALIAFAEGGGLLVVDHAPYLNDHFPPLFGSWRQYDNPTPRTYSIGEQIPITVQVGATALHLPSDAELLASFNDGSPALCKIKRGQGTILLSGSYLGWDYSNYPGNYDLAEMFPFHIRRDVALRQAVAGWLADSGIKPPVVSEHPEVEAALWQSEQNRILFVINHLQETIETAIHIDDQVVAVKLAPLQGMALQL